MITKLETLKNKDLHTFITDVLNRCDGRDSLAYSMLFKFSLLPVETSGEELIELFKRWNMDTTDLRLHNDKLACANEYIKDKIAEHLLHFTPYTGLKLKLLDELATKRASELQHFISKGLQLGTIFDAYSKLDENCKIVVMYYIRNRTNVESLRLLCPEEYKTLQVFLNHVIFGNGNK